MTKAIEDAANALAIRTALGVPTNAELAAVYDVADAAYVKPADGIPHNDLHTGIRDQLDLAETALQPGALPIDTTVTAEQISDAGAAGRTLLQKATLPEIQSLVSGAPAQSPTLLYVGDSRMQQHWGDAAGTIISTNPLTIQLTNHRLNTGDFVSLNFMAPDAANGCWPVTRISANQFSVPYAGAASGTPSVYYKHSPSPRGIYTWASAALAELGFTTTLNLAVGGMRSDQILAMLPAMLDRAGSAAYGAVAATLCGVNDRAQFPARTVDEVFTNLLGIWDLLRARGCYIHALTEIPLGSGHSAFSAAFVGWQARLSRKIVEYWSGRTDGIALDVFGLISDPAQIDGRARVGMHYDNIHPAPLGAERMGAYIANTVRAARKITRDRASSWIDSYAADASSTQYLNNPMLQGASGVVNQGSGIGTVAGAAPTDFVFELQSGPSSQAVTLTTVARADGRGNNLNINVTGATATTAFRIRNSGSGSADLRTRLAPGQKFLIEADLQWACTALKFLSVASAITIDGVLSDFAALVPSTESYPQAAGGLFRSEICTVAPSSPGIVSTGQYLIAAAFSGSGGGTITVSSPRIVIVP